MKTKDLIKLLKDVDPDGETHVYIRGEGSAIQYVGALPGYYDGSYSYLKWKGKDTPGEKCPDEIVISKEGVKIAIYTMDWEGMAWQDGKITLDVKDKKGYQKRIKEIKEKKERFEQKSLEHHTVEVLNKIKEGYKVVQPPSKKIGIYNVMWYLKGNNKKDIEAILKNDYDYNMKTKKIDRLCQGDCGAVLNSGLFKVVKGGLIEWQLKI